MPPWNRTTKLNNNPGVRRVREVRKGHPQPQVEAHAGQPPAEANCLRRPQVQCIPLVRSTDVKLILYITDWISCYHKLPCDIHRSSVKRPKIEIWYYRKSGWPSGLRRCVQVAVHFGGRGFESHFWHEMILFSSILVQWALVLTI